MGWVAKDGGQITAACPGETHSQITLAAATLSPASGVPSAPNRSPLPFGRLPRGRFIVRAVSATAAGSSDGDAGSTSVNSAQAPENPASAAGLMSVSYRA